MQFLFENWISKNLLNRRYEAGKTYWVAHKMIDIQDFLSNIFFFKNGNASLSFEKDCTRKQKWAPVFYYYYYYFYYSHYNRHN